MLLPVRDMKASIQYMEDNLQIYPMWLCPMRVVRHTDKKTKREVGFLHVSKQCKGDSEMYVDIGIYGPPGKPYDHVRDMRNLEAFVREHQGYQGLYAVCYMDKKEFRTMFHHETYDECRVKYGADKRFPEVHDKTSGRN